MATARADRRALAQGSTLTFECRSGQTGPHLGCQILTTKRCLCVQVMTFTELGVSSTVGRSAMDERSWSSPTTAMSLVIGMFQALSGQTTL